MLKWLESRILWGSLLILGGVLFLLQNLGMFEVGGVFWGILFGLAGVFFLSIFFQNQANWWSIIPGFTLLGISAQVILDQFAPKLAEMSGGAIVLGAIGVSFLLVYFADRQNWWALIPMGVLLTLALVSSLDAFTQIDTGGIFFMGLGATFALVALIPRGSETRWAWIPAGILFVLGVFVFAADEALLAYLWPSALILVGVYLIFRSMRFRRTG